MSRPPGSRRRFLILPAAAALAGVLFAAGLLRRGVVMGPDSWAYWEGSVSLMETGNYSYFGGEPITSFPPLFSWVLALFQSALGVSGRTLAVSLAAFVAAASFAWTALYTVLSDKKLPFSWPDALAAIYIPATLAIYAQTLLSEALWHALVPVLLLLILLPAGPARLGWRACLKAAGVCVVLALMLLCRNVTVALLPGVFLLLIRQDVERPLYRRAAMASASIAGALLPWYWMRRWLGQLANHPIGTSRQGFLENAAEVLRGLAYALGPTRWSIGPALLVGICALVVWDVADRARTERPEGRALHIRMVEFAVLGLAGLAGLFSATHVGEPLAGRFVVFAALVLVLAIFSAGQARPKGPLRNALVGAAILISVAALYRVGIKYRLAGREQEATPLNVRISSAYWSGPARAIGAHVLVAPPSYPWMRRGGRTQ